MSNDTRDVEKTVSRSASDNHIERLRTAGGHIDDRSQAGLPVLHRSLASPSPLGLLSFATGIFLIAMYGLHARSIATPNVLVGVLMFFGGICQFIAGILEFVTGNTFGATVFPSYAAFNFSYAMIYLPGTGILAAYTDPATGTVRPEFSQALSIYIWAWFILTVIFTIAAMRSSWVLFMDLFMLDICLLLLACGYMTGINGLLTAGNAFGLVVAFLSSKTVNEKLYHCRQPSPQPSPAPSNTDLEKQISSLSVLLQQNIQATNALLQRQGQQRQFVGASLELPCHDNGSPNLAHATTTAASNTPAPTPARIGRLVTSASNHVRFVPLRGVDDTCLIGDVQEPGADELSGFPLFPDNIPRQARVLLDLLPPARLCDQLVGIFFDVISPLFHILHDTTFLAKYQNFRNNRPSVTPSFLALIFVQLALAVTTLDDDSPILQELGHENSPSANVRNLAARYRSAAMRCLVADNFMWHHSLCTVQSLVLLIYAISHDQGPSWTLLGSALHIAIAIGCSVDPINLDVNLIEAEERRRCWAALKMLYTIQNTCLGNIAPFKLEDDVALPADVDDELLDMPDALSLEERPGRQPTKMTYILYKFRLYNLAHEICRLSSCARPPDQETVTHLAARLSTEQLCHMERFAHIHTLPIYHVAHFYILSIYSHNLSLLLHRSQISASYLDHTAQESLKQCTESALRILSNFEVLCTSPEFRPYRWYTYGLGSFYAFLAIITLAAILPKRRHVPETSDMVVKAIISGCQILLQAAERSEVCAKASSTLRSLIGKLPQVRDNDASTTTLDAEDATLLPRAFNNGESESWDSALQLDSFLQTVSCEQWLMPTAFPWSSAS
ncbi:hypothetical protein ZTR_09987 [Talaromyces verruculosus]|nr:hypothetical protein ZTR_09987 [Talaromyces verruculosus]